MKLSDRLAAYINRVPPKFSVLAICYAIRMKPELADTQAFTGFMRILYALPHPDAVLLNPDTADVPTDPASLYALSDALALLVEASNMDRLVTYLNRVPLEFSVRTIRYALRKKPELANTRAFTRWSSSPVVIKWFSDNK